LFTELIISKLFGAKRFWICGKLFKTGKIAIGQLSKVVALGYPLFKKELFSGNLFARF
jgi:hypothetical protein